MLDNGFRDSTVVEPLRTETLRTAKNCVVTNMEDSDEGGLLKLARPISQSIQKRGLEHVKGNVSFS